MTRDRIQLLEIPQELRAVTEQGVNQTKQALTNYFKAAREAVFVLEQWVEGSQGGALGISKKAMSFAERNALSAFECAQKIVHAKDVQEVIQIQTEFVQTQIEAVGQQLRELTEIAAMAAQTAVKNGTNTAKAA